MIANIILALFPVLPLLAAAQSDPTTATYTTTTPTRTQAETPSDASANISQSGIAQDAAAMSVNSTTTAPVISSSESPFSTTSSSPASPTGSETETSLQASTEPSFAFNPSSSSSIYDSSSSSFRYEPTSSASFEYVPTTSVFPPAIWTPATEHRDQSLNPSSSTSAADDSLETAATMQSQTSLHTPVFSFAPSPAAMHTESQLRVPTQPAEPSASVLTVAVMQFPKVPSDQQQPAASPPAEPHDAVPAAPGSPAPSTAPLADAAITDAPSAMTAGVQSIWHASNGNVMLGSYTLKPGTKVIIATPPTPPPSDQIPPRPTTLETAAPPTGYGAVEAPSAVTLNGHTITISSQSVPTAQMVTYQGQTISMSGLTLAAEPTPKPNDSAPASSGPSGSYQEPWIVDSGIGSFQAEIGMALLIALSTLLFI